MTPWLSDDEVAALCEPIEQPAAMVRFLRGKGLHVERKPNGKPILMRSELERVMGAQRMFPNPSQNGPSSTPNRSALMTVLKGGKHGPQTQGR